MTATRNNWKIQPIPSHREHLHLPLLFSPSDAERLLLGHIPQDMDDRWFIFFESDWLYFHRSWTGDCIFAVRLGPSPIGVRIIDAWASRDRERYNSPGVESETEVLHQLITTKLLT